MKEALAVLRQPGTAVVTVQFKTPAAADFFEVQLTKALRQAARPYHRSRTRKNRRQHES